MGTKTEDLPDLLQFIYRALRKGIIDDGYGDRGVTPAQVRNRMIKEDWSRCDAVAPRGSTTVRDGLFDLCRAGLAVQVRKVGGHGVHYRFTIPESNRS